MGGRARSSWPPPRRRAATRRRAGPRWGRTCPGRRVSCGVAAAAERGGEWRRRGGALGAPAGLAAPGLGDFPPAFRGNPKARRREPPGERRRGGGPEEEGRGAALATPSRLGAGGGVPPEELGAAAGSTANPGKGRVVVRTRFQGDESACPARDFVVGCSSCAPSAWRPATSPRSPAAAHST